MVYLFTLPDTSYSNRFFNILFLCNTGTKSKQFRNLWKNIWYGNNVWGSWHKCRT